jgi:hypothetical protein
MNNNKREFERVAPKNSVLVKEDTGEIINYYHLKNISNGGMFLLKKISSKTENNSTYTFLVPGVSNTAIIGEVFETRLDDSGTYGTAIKFVNNKDAEPVVKAIRNV